MNAGIGVIVLVFIVWLVMREIQEKEHVHQSVRWDGWREWCSCGASAGDKKDSKGVRYTYFSEWPES